MDVRLVTGPKWYQTLSTKFVLQKCYVKNLVAFRKIKEVWTVNKPAYVVILY